MTLTPHPLDAHLDLIKRAVDNVLRKSEERKVETVEVVSECYLHLRVKFHTYDPEFGPLAPWVYRVARRHAVETIMSLLNYRRHYVKGEDGRCHREFRCHQVPLTDAHLRGLAA